MKREFRDLYYSLVNKDRYIDFLPGNSNVVITAPHGGGMKPISIPRRKGGKQLMDTYTRRLARKINSYNFENKAHCLIADIHRSRVDLNREIIEGAETNKRAKEVWYDWNESLEYLFNELLKKYDKVIYIDLHSQASNDKFQLGFDISAERYRSLYMTGKGDFETTLDALGDNKHELLFGENSVSYLLEQSGYRVYMPLGDENYYNGGRGISYYKSDRIGAMQIECPVRVVKKNFNDVSLILGSVINSFAKVY